MKILYVTTVSSTMNFFINHIKMLCENDNIVHLACNMQDKKLSDEFNNYVDNVYNICFSRQPLSFDNIKAIKQLKSLIRDGGYDIVHTHTPNASFITRLVCRKYRKSGLRVFYTAHGFHFFKGAPLKNWLLYYPIEWICAHWTDALITINTEDYNLAKKHMHSKRVYYVPGVGLDMKRFSVIEIDCEDKRKELNILPTDIMLLSVGEINKNKNHISIIKSIAKINEPNIHYFIAGEGHMRNRLIRLSKKLGIDNNIHLLGFRDDIAELCKVADIFCFPSRREGLGMAALEAMASGLPLITSNVHGINDYSVNEKTGYKCKPNSISQFKNHIIKLIDSPELRAKMGKYNEIYVKKFEFENVVDQLKKIYKCDELDDIKQQYCSKV